MFVRVILIAALAWSASACGDDDGDGKGTPTPMEDAGANNGGEDAGGDVAPDDGGADADSGEDEPDAPEPQNDQERVLFVPETESWGFPELEADVHVVRTEGNIPHVFAESRHDLGYVLGFIVARDRFFVMDLQRRLALGRLSELLGDLALPNDLEARYTGMTYVAQRVLEGLSEEDGAYLDAYAAGINEYIRRVAAGELPPPSELEVASGLLGASSPADLMKPFDRESVAAMVAVIIYQTNFETGDVGRHDKAQALDTLYQGAVKEELRRQGARVDIWDRLETPFPYASAPGWGVHEGDSQQKAGRRAKFRSSAREPLALRKSIDATMLQRTSQRLESLTRRLGKWDVENFGSNTWAVSGAHSADGAALVAGDGHLRLYVPSIMYQVGMNTELFGGGDIHQAGLLITSLPLLAVGTNGHVAYSQVNPVSDITDWYREELQLDADGLPAASLFDGTWEPLVAVEETFEIANVPILDSVGRTEALTRWTTFDGRFLFDIEGRPYTEGDTLEAGESAIALPGRQIVPSDVDGDGRVTAISFDYTAFDTTRYVGTLRQFTEAKDVYEYQEASKGLIGNMLYSAVADDQGNILFTSYQAVPCRTYLPREEGGAWQAGADPTMLLDGTVYGGFSIPSQDDGKVDEAPGATDPYKCVVPFDQTPQAINPSAGFVVNANNQPAPITDDGSLSNDPWYIGGPWASVRADSIAGELTKAVAEGTADVDKMAEIQAFTRSRLGELFLPHLLAALDRAEALAASTEALDPDQQRLADLFGGDTERLAAARARLEAWRDGGFRTPSGVETFYDSPTDQDRGDAVATMIFNAWLPRALQAAFDDEELHFAHSGARMRFRAMLRLLDGRGEGNPGELASWDVETGESAFFDDLATADRVERSDELLVGSMVAALDFLTSAPTGPAQGGFGTDDMNQWLWGMRHQARFESLLGDFLEGNASFGFLTDLFSITTDTLPLAEGLTADDPRKKLKWFPRPGDFYAVDAASPSFNGTSFTYASGPVMRMVIALKDGQVWGQNVVPGGQSGLTDSPFFADQAALWLGNEALPLRYHAADVAAGATGREHYRAE